jgi:hypothetical protein
VTFIVPQVRDGADRELQHDALVAEDLVVVQELSCNL